MQHYTVTSILQRDSDSDWHYLHISKDVRDDLKSHEKRGHVAVTATIGTTTWDGSLMPWADGSAQLTVNSTVRRKENLTEGDKVTVIIAPRE